MVRRSLLAVCLSLPLARRIVSFSASSMSHIAVRMSVLAVRMSGMHVRKWKLLHGTPDVGVGRMDVGFSCLVVGC